MRKSYLVAIAILAFALQVWAGNGLMDGTGPQINLYAGEPIYVSGLVTAVPSPGNPGLKIDTGTETVTIYGLGPSWFWERMGVAYPAVGEEVAVEGYKVTMSDGSERIIATKLTVSGQTINLRGDDGRPAWRGGRFGAGSKADSTMGRGFGRERRWLSN